MKTGKFWSDKLRTEISRFCEFRGMTYTEFARMAFGNPNKLKDFMGAKRVRFTIDDAGMLLAIMGIRPDRFFGWSGVEDLTTEQIVKSCRKNKNITKTVNALMKELKRGADD